MDLLSQYRLNPYRVYKVSKRINKGMAVFMGKTASSYLDYSVDFSRRLQENERILSGAVTVNGSGLSIETVVANGSYLTAFIDAGAVNNTYYLTYEAQTNLGGAFIQDMVLAITGKGERKAQHYSYLAFIENVKPPDKKPPLNAIRINNRYLLNGSGFFMGI